jgi:hypothetical protein
MGKYCIERAGIVSVAKMVCDGEIWTAAVPAYEFHNDRCHIQFSYTYPASLRRGESVNCGSYQDTARKAHHNVSSISKPISNEP